MGIRLKIILFCAMCWLMYTGVTSVVEGMRLRTPTTIAIDKLAKEKPGGGWYKVTDGVFSVAEAGYTYKKDSTSQPTEIKEIYIPMRYEGEVADNAKLIDSPIHIMVKTSDPAIIGAFTKVKDVDEKQAAKLKESDLFIQRDVQGMIASSLHSIDSADEKALREGSKNLAPDCVFLSEGEKPSSPLGGLAMIGGGVLCGLLFAGSMLGGLKKSA